MIKTLISWATGGGLGVYAALAVVALLAGGLLGWTVNGWRLDARAESVAREHAEALAAQTKKVLDLTKARDAIKDEKEAESARYQAELDRKTEQVAAANGRLDDALDRLRQRAAVLAADGTVRDGAQPAADCSELAAANYELARQVANLARSGSDIARQGDAAVEVARTCKATWEAIAATDGQ